MKKRVNTLNKGQEADSLFQALDSISHTSQNERLRIVPLLQTQALAKAEYFVRGGDRTRKIGFVVTGLLRYYYIAEDGREFTRAFHQEGRFVASMSALLFGGPSHYFIQALEDCTLLTIEYSDWVGLQESSAEWTLINKKFLEGSLLQAEKRERSLILDDAATRYQALLNEFPAIETRVKQQDIASYLGITPVFLSKIRGRPAPKSI